MRSVAASELSTFKMVAGNERKYKKVIDGDVVKEWIGFGWIELERPTEQEKKTLPHVRREK